MKNSVRAMLYALAIAFSVYTAPVVSTQDQDEPAIPTAKLTEQVGNMGSLPIKVIVLFALLGFAALGLASATDFVPEGNITDSANPLPSLDTALEVLFII